MGLDNVKEMIIKRNIDMFYKKDDSHVNLVIKGDNYFQQKNIVVSLEEIKKNIKDKNFLFNIVSLSENIENKMVNFIKEKSISIYSKNFNSIDEIILYLMSYDEIMDFINSQIIELFINYGFISNVFDEDGNAKYECNIYNLVVDLISIYYCFYLYLAIKEDLSQNYDNLYLFSIVYKTNKEKNAINFINDFLKRKEDVSYIKYYSTYNDKDKIWELNKNDNAMQLILYELRKHLSEDYVGGYAGYYICNNCGKPFLRINKNQKYCNRYDNPECGKEYDRKRQKKSYDKKKANK